MTPVEAERAERRLALAHELTSRALIEDAERLWPALAHALMRYFDCERAVIFQRDPKGVLRSRCAQGPDDALVATAGRSLAGAAVAAGGPVVAGAALAFPLLYRGLCLGVVELLDKAEGFSQTDLDDAGWLTGGLAVIFAKASAEEEKADLTRRMVHVEKMAALGRMAGGIAHEVNNPLAAVLGLSSVLMRRADTSPESLPTLLKIDAEIRRVQKLVADLLGFSRGSPPALHDVDLRLVAKETMELTKPEFSARRVRVMLEAAKDLPLARGDAHALKQVLLNLLLNAAQAMDERGGLVRLVLAARPDRVEARVIDDGPGVSAEIADQIFEPFFTTKPEGQGTGLGLYVSAELVRRLEGRLAHEPAPGGGAVFRFDLPRA